jgi:signal peptidase I
LQIKDGTLFINSAAVPFPPKSEMYYDVESKGQVLDPTTMKEEYDVDMDGEKSELIPRTDRGKNQYTIQLTWDAKEKMIKNGFANSIKLHMEPGRTSFPYDSIHKDWVVDNYGPLWVPKKDASITITPENYSIYNRIINVYEHNKAEWRAGKLFINDSATSQYTFKMNYYWMMGDNRHGSQDSRFWGFVPEDHVVGEAWLIWMSWEHGVRWSRLFRRIH